VARDVHRITPEDSKQDHPMPPKFRSEHHGSKNFKTRDSRGLFRVDDWIEIAAPVEQVFGQWSQYETFPYVVESVRRIKRVDDQHILWDVDIAGRQVVWVARVVEYDPEKRIRWRSDEGASHSGEVRFEALPGDRTRLSVEMAFRPRGVLETLGARLGLVDAQVGRDLACFRRFVERRASDWSRRHRGGSAPSDVSTRSDVEGNPGAPRPGRSPDSSYPGSRPSSDS
jgi:uncharacterized membrane protein